jgi:hypothetical protein
MRRARALLVAALLVAGLGVAGCSKSHHEAAAQAVRVDPIPGTGLTRVELSPEAAARIGVRTAPSRVVGGGSRQLTLVPYTAILYDPNGVPSVYTSPSPRVYIRHPVALARLSGAQAYVTRGVPPGAMVVTSGGPELLGAETGVEG